MVTPEKSRLAVSLEAFFRHAGIQGQDRDPLLGGRGQQSGPEFGLQQRDSVGLGGVNGPAHQIRAIQRKIAGKDGDRSGSARRGREFFQYVQALPGPGGAKQFQGASGQGGVGGQSLSQGRGKRVDQPGLAA